MSFTCSTWVARHLRTLQRHRSLRPDKRGRNPYRRPAVWRRQLSCVQEFAWRFVNIIAQSLVALGRRPDYEQIRRHVINIDELFIEYAQKYFAEHDPKAWETIVALEAKIDRKNLSFAMKDRPLRVVAVDMYLTQKRINDSVMDGLRSWCAMTRPTSTRSSHPCCLSLRNSPRAGLQSYSPRTTWIFRISAPF